MAHHGYGEMQNMKRLPLVVSFLLFIALCASIAYWAMQLFKPPLRPVAAPPPTAQSEVRPEAAAALFGGRAEKAAVASNYQLKGVIFSGSPRNSVAILSADGKPAQAVRVDMEVVPGVTVKEVHREYVLLSEGGTTKRVELPESAKGQAELAYLAPVPMPPPAAPATAPPSAPSQQIPSRAQAAAAAAAPAAGAPATPATTTPSTAAAASPAPVPGQSAAPAAPPPATAASASPIPSGVVPSVQLPPTAPPTVVVSPPPSPQPVAPAAAPSAAARPTPSTAAPAAQPAPAPAATPSYPARTPSSDTAPLISR